MQQITFPVNVFDKNGKLSEKQRWVRKINNFDELLFFIEFPGFSNSSFEVTIYVPKRKISISAVKEDEFGKVFEHINIFIEKKFNVKNASVSYENGIFSLRVKKKNGLVWLRSGEGR